MEIHEIVFLCGLGLGNWDYKDFFSEKALDQLNFTGTPKRVKILDFQALTLGHPAFDIWSIVYAATDGKYRADHLEEDLRAYYTIFSTYMDTKADYSEFRQELEERRVMGMVMYGSFCFATLSPTPLPNPATETSKFGKACREMLAAEETPEDHPDLKEIRRRVMSNMKEMVDRDFI